MKWINLKNNKCPCCNKDFVKGLVVTSGGKIDDMVAGDLSGKMMIHPCGFMITEQRYKEIISSQVTKILNESLCKKTQDQY